MYSSRFYPLDTGCQSDVHNTFRRRLGQLQNIFFMFTLRFCVHQVVPDPLNWYIMNQILGIHNTIVSSSKWKNVEPIKQFKSGITFCVPENCSCKLCKYLPNNVLTIEGFLGWNTSIHIRNEIDFEFILISLFWLFLLCLLLYYFIFNF